MMGKKEKFSIILITILLISNLLLFKILSKVDNKIMDIKDLNSQLRKDIDSISKNVNESVKELTDEQRWLKLGSKDILSFSDDLKEANVKIKWSLRELNKGDEVYLIYGSYNNDPSEVENWEIALIDENNNLNYEENLTLSTDKNYYFKVEVKNSSKTIIENLTNIELNDMIEDRIQIQTYFKTRTSTNINMYMNVVNNNNLMKNTVGDINLSEEIKNKLKIKNISYDIYIDGEKILTKQLLKDGLEEIDGLKIENDHGLEILDYAENLNVDNDMQYPATIIVYVEDYFGRIDKNIFDDR